MAAAAESGEEQIRHPIVYLPGRPLRPANPTNPKVGPKLAASRQAAAGGGRSQTLPGIARHFQWHEWLPAGASRSCQSRVAPASQNKFKRSFAIATFGSEYEPQTITADSARRSAATRRPAGALVLITAQHAAVLGRARPGSVGRRQAGWRTHHATLCPRRSGRAGGGQGVESPDTASCKANLPVVMTKVKGWGAWSLWESWRAWRARRARQARRAPRARGNFVTRKWAGMATPPQGPARPGRLAALLR